MKPTEVDSMNRLRVEAEDEVARLKEALHDAATSLETLASLSGRKTYGNPPIETYMDSFMNVRLYAAARARAARESLAARREKRQA